MRRVQSHWKETPPEKEGGGFWSLLGTLALLAVIVVILWDVFREEAPDPPPATPPGQANTVPAPATAPTPAAGPKPGTGATLIQGTVAKVKTTPRPVVSPAPVAPSVPDSNTWKEMVLDGLTFSLPAKVTSKEVPVELTEDTNCTIGHAQCIRFDGADAQVFFYHFIWPVGAAFHEDGLRSTANTMQELQKVTFHSTYTNKATIFGGYAKRTLATGEQAGKEIAIDSFSITRGSEFWQIAVLGQADKAKAMADKIFADVKLVPE